MKKSVSPNVIGRLRQADLEGHRVLKSPDGRANANYLSRSHVLVHGLGQPARDPSKSLQRSKSKRGLSQKRLERPKESPPLTVLKDKRLKQPLSIEKLKPTTSKNKGMFTNTLFNKRLSVCSQGLEHDKKRSVSIRPTDPSKERLAKRKSPSNSSAQTKMLSRTIFMVTAPRKDLSNNSKYENARVSHVQANSRGKERSKDAKSIKAGSNIDRMADLNLNKPKVKSKRKQTFLNQRPPKEGETQKEYYKGVSSGPPLELNSKEFEMQFKDKSRMKVVKKVPKILEANFAEFDPSDVPLAHSPTRKDLLKSRSRSKLPRQPPEEPAGTRKPRQKKKSAEKQKNSLRELLSEYNQLKNGVDVERLDINKLSKLKTKLNHIQGLIDRRLLKAGRGEPCGVHERAAIVIQKFARGYLVRKFINKYLVRTNPTFESFEAMDHPPPDSLHSLSQLPEPGDVTIDRDLYEPVRLPSKPVRPLNLFKTPLQKDASISFTNKDFHSKAELSDYLLINESGKDYSEKQNHAGLGKGSKLKIRKPAEAQLPKSKVPTLNQKSSNSNTPNFRGRRERLDQD